VMLKVTGMRGNIPETSLQLMPFMLQFCIDDNGLRVTGLPGVPGHSTLRFD